MKNLKDSFQVDILKWIVFAPPTSQIQIITRNDSNYIVAPKAIEDLAHFL